MIIFYELSLLLIIPSIVNGMEWLRYKQVHNKVFSNETNDDKRKAIFEINLAKITENNKKYENNTTTFKLGINEFSDMKHEEFSKKYLTLKSRPMKNSSDKKPIMLANFHNDAIRSTNNNLSTTIMSWPYNNLSTKVDWRTVPGVVGPVKNQNVIIKIKFI